MADYITAKQLREERMPLAHKIKEMNDKAQSEKRLFTAEEDTNWKQLNADYDALTNRIEMAERCEAVLAEQVAPAVQVKNVASPAAEIPNRGDYDGRKALENFDPGRREEASEADHALALQAWLRTGEGMDLRPEHQRACRVTGVNAYAKNLEVKFGSGHGSYNTVKRNFRNALSGNDGASGAFTRPEGFVNNLEQALLYFANMRQVAEVMRTGDGNPLPWPTANNTSNTGYIVGENETNTTQQQPTMGRSIFSAYEYTSGFIRIPNSLLTDSAFDLAAIAGTMQGEMIGRRQATDFTTGTGVNQATGFVTACAANGATVSAASATAITFDDLYGLKHGVDPAYRDMGCQWMLHDTILLAIRKLKDGNGQYLWQTSRVSGQPDTIDGDPLFINQAMDSTIASGKYTVAYGVFSKYKIRDVNGVVMRRADERYIENNQTGFISFLRSDGNLIDAGTKPIKLLSH